MAEPDLWLRGDTEAFLENEKRHQGAILVRVYPSLFVIVFVFLCSHTSTNTLAASQPMKYCSVWLARKHFVVRLGMSALPLACVHSTCLQM